MNDACVIDMNQLKSISLYQYFDKNIFGCGYHRHVIHNSIKINSNKGKG